jgi:hypothetical protein
MEPYIIVEKYCLLKLVSKSDRNYVWLACSNHDKYQYMAIKLRKKKEEIN